MVKPCQSRVRDAARKGTRTIDEAQEKCLDVAREEWFQGKFQSVMKAASAHNVGYNTLRRRIKGTALPKKKAHDGQALLTHAEKDVLVEWIQYLGFTGHPVNKRTLRPKVHAILWSKGRKVDAKTVSKNWIRCFLLENSEKVKAARGHGLDTKRAQAFNFVTVHRHFELLSSILKADDVPWENVYNMDEKGFQLGGGRKNSQEKFFYSRRDKMMYKQKGDSLELVTIIDCVCADGTATIKPVFIFTGATKFDDWFEVDDDILCVFHSSGDLHVH